MQYGKVFALRNGLVVRHITDHEHYECACQVLVVPDGCTPYKRGETPVVGDIINLLNPPPVEGSALPETGAPWVGGYHGEQFDVMLELEP